MNSPLLDASAVTPNPATVNLTPRQRLEGALAQLPAVAGSAAAQSQSSQPALLDRQELVEPVQRINESLAGFGVEFQLSEPDKHLVARIVDRESGELIRQIPSEEVLRVIDNLDKMRGRLLEETA